MRSAWVLVCAAALAGALARAQPPAFHRIIVDTDFALPPQDDGLALAFALNSPELDIAGITTVAGNYNLARANADVLRMLEIAGPDRDPRASRRPPPLAHRQDTFATTHYGRWWSDEAAPPPGGSRRKRSIRRRRPTSWCAPSRPAPGEIEIVAIGPLTNVATAIRRSPGLRKP